MAAIILVVAGNQNWTFEALHLAAALARETAGSITLIEMTPVAHLEYLGAGVRETLLPAGRAEALRQYASTIEDYGIPVTVSLFEYTDYIGGVTSAAEQAGAVVVFAPAPTGVLHGLRLWYLRHTLRRPLYTLGVGDGVSVWAPQTIGIEPSR